MVLVNSLGSDFEIIILVSPAKRTGLARPAVVSGRSFIYSTKIEDQGWSLGECHI
jgi:hypothetical protein